MKRIVLSFCLAALSVFGQYKLESAGGPPTELATETRDALQKDGAKVLDSKGETYCELWLRTQAPEGKNSESSVTFKDLPHGAFLGVIRFPAQAMDRRGQAVKPGLYTMRLSFYPVDGAHQGVALQRDFALLTPAADDKDPNSTPTYKQVVEMSIKASGTAHPAVLSIWQADAVKPASLKQEGEDWVLYTTLGDKPLAIILVGVHQG